MNKEAPAMTPANFCKSHGLKGLKHLSLMSGIPPSTLNGWYYDPEKKKAFRLLVVGLSYDVRQKKIAEAKASLSK